MSRLQREMNQLMDTFGQDRRNGFPPLNVWANQEKAIVTAELPGVAADDLEISVVGESVTLSGNRPLPETGEDVTWHRHERWHGEFSRTLQMPFRIDVESVDATFKNGVLHVTLPRAAEDRPKRISVGS
jgi:HSP20 family protein